MRPTDFCHLNDLRVPVPRVFPARYATFIAWTPHGVLGSVRSDRGTECFTTLGTLRRIVSGHALPYCLVLLAFGAPFPVREEAERGRFIPTAPVTDRASDNLCRLFLCRGVSSERLRDSF
jgi:hypothetical protein